MERLGARPWAARARTELRGSGERMRREAPVAAERLTPQELQVALEVTRGSTNREAAAALFLSPNTVEFHLRNIYRKLSIRSRTELVRVVLSLPATFADLDSVRTRGEQLPVADGRPRDAAPDG